MKQVEREVYSALNTIYLRILLNGKGLRQFDNQQSAGKHFILAMKSMRNSADLSVKAYNHFVKRFNPLNNAKFTEEISQYIARCSEVIDNAKLLCDKNDYERLIHALHLLRTECCFVVRLNATDQEGFSPDEYTKIMQNGLVTFPKSTKDDMVNGWLNGCGAITYLVQDESRINLIIGKLQLSGLQVQLKTSRLRTGTPGQIIFESSKAI